MTLKKSQRKQKEAKMSRRKYYITDDYLINDKNLYPVPLFQMF